MSSPAEAARHHAGLIAASLSLGAGVLLGISIRINATLGMYVGPLEATFVVHLVGTVFAVMLLRHRLNRSFARRAWSRPRYELAGGVLGVMMVFIANIIVPVLGTALAVSLFIMADLFFSSLADHFGWFDFRRIRISWRRVLGLLLVAIGVLLVRWG